MKLNEWRQAILSWPEVRPEDLTLESPGVIHALYQHDDWCLAINGGKASDCNCNPTVSFHRQPDWH